MLVVQRVFGAKRTNLHEKYDYPGQATHTDFHGYPMRYQTHFADIQAVLPNGPPTDPKRWDGIHDLQQFEDRIARCSNAQVVTVTAWDRD